MIDGRAQELLSEGSAQVEMDGCEGGVTLFADHKGDSVVVRVFRYWQGDPVRLAGEWLELARLRCESLGGDLVSSLVVVPAVGAGPGEFNVVAVVGGYDLVGGD